MSCSRLLCFGFLTFGLSAPIANAVPLQAGTYHLALTGFCNAPGIGGIYSGTTGSLVYAGANKTGSILYLTSASNSEGFTTGELDVIDLPIAKNGVSSWTGKYSGTDYSRSLFTTPATATKSGSGNVTIKLTANSAVSFNGTVSFNSATACSLIVFGAP